MSSTELERQASAFIGRHAMLFEDARVLIACSGGPDSMALLDLLVRMRRRWRLALAVAHLDHGLRDAASDDAQFVQRAADVRGLTCFADRVDTAELARANRRGLEEQGRTSRFEFLTSLAEEHGFDRVALGHNRDDQAETFLMRLLRGSGSRGLASAYPVRDGRFIRPLLDTSRAEILGFLQTTGSEFLRDPTNEDTRFRRNLIRHDTLPRLIRDFNPALVSRLAQTADILREEDAFLDEVTRKTFDAMSVGGSAAIRLSIPAFEGLPRALARRVVRRALRLSRGDLGDIAMVHVEDVLSLTQPGKSGRSLDLPGIRVRRDFDVLGFLPEAPTGGDHDTSGYNGYEYSLEIPAQLVIPETGDRLIVEPWTTARGQDDWPRASGASVMVGTRSEMRCLTVRSLRKGDRFQPFGADGRKSVARYLMDRGVDQHRRARIPLLVDERGAILWIAGHGISEEARLGTTDADRRALHLQWKVQ